MNKYVAAMLLAGVGLTGCEKLVPAGDGSMRHGERYFGIGIYSPGALWEQLVRKDRPKDGTKDPQAALLADDSEIIVSVDSRTGEVRQCGNYSGYCISSNPWSGEVGTLPVALAKHASDIWPEKTKAATTADVDAK